MNDLLSHLNGTGMADGAIVLAWTLGIALGVVAAALLLLAIF